MSLIIYVIRVSLLHAMKRLGVTINAPFENRTYLLHSRHIIFHQKFVRQSISPFFYFCSSSSSVLTNFEREISQYLVVAIWRNFFTLRTLFFSFHLPYHSKKINKITPVCSVVNVSPFARSIEFIFEGRVS